jgi:hypothetical protein
MLRKLLLIAGAAIVAPIWGVTLVARADDVEGPAVGEWINWSPTGCESRTDTNCLVLRYDYPTPPDYIVAVRFVDEGRFCIEYRYPNRWQRCEEYWPFNRPVINSGLEDAPHRPPYGPGQF